MGLYERIDQLCKSNDISKRKFEIEAGLAVGSTSKWKKYNPGQKSLEKVANYFNVTTDYLLNGTEEKENTNRNVGVKIPVLGTVAAGIPIEAIENILDYEEIPERMSKTGKFFGLQIKGNSMNPRFQEGDVVIVRQQPDAENGDIVIAKVNGNDATCKKLIKHQNGITLQSFNPAYAPFYYSNEEIESTPVTIIGKVVELRAKF